MTSRNHMDVQRADFDTLRIPRQGLAPQLGAHPRQQFFHAERFGHIVVCTQIKPLNRVRLLVKGSGPA